MARKTVLVSDLTGQEIPDGEPATIRIDFADRRRHSVRLDVMASEVGELVSKGEKVGRRGRRPKDEPAT